MKTSYKIALIVAVVLVMIFLALMTVLSTIDVKAIGPEGSRVGLATLNGAFRDAIGYSEVLEKLSDATGLIQIATAVGFAVVGIVQLVRRKRMSDVDRDVILLGMLYLTIIVLYISFELFAVNFRPVAPDGKLESSFPSTHALIAVAIAGTAVIYFARSIKNAKLRIALIAVSSVSGLATLVLRTLSGVHWITDIIGGVIIAAALILLYVVAVEISGRGYETIQ